MKILSISILLLLGGLFSNAQNTEGKTDDLGRIVLNAYVSDQVEGLPASAKNALANKLNQITTKAGLGGSAFVPRFIITPNITVLSKDVTPTAPPMVALALDVTIYVGDGLDGTLFDSESMTLKGVGTNEAKAYMGAIKQIKGNNPNLQNLIKTGKTKIIQYYNDRCDYIIKEAQTLGSQNEYGAAILKLTSVPEVCKECFVKCMDAVEPYYVKQIERECKMKLQEAQGIWAANQDMASAERAGAILATVEPEASCFGEVKALSSEIASRVQKIDAREWKYVLKDQTQESERISSYKAVGVAYGNGQPKTVSYNVRGWFP